MENRKYESIQYIRGVLFLAILGFHCGAPGFSFGWGGVETFFVISAFFIVRKYSDKTNLTPFSSVWDRVRRIYPPYVVVILMSALIVISYSHFPGIKDLISHFFLVQNLQWVFCTYDSGYQMYTQHLWTMCMELWVGCSLILVVQGKKIPVRPVAVGAIVIAVLFRTALILFSIRIELITLCPIAYLDSFGLGALLSDDIRNCKMKKNYLYLSGAIGLIGILYSIYIIGRTNGVDYLEAYTLLRNSIYYMNNPISGNIFFFIALLSVAVVGLLVLREKGSARKNINVLKRFFLFLGNESFLLYLFHWPILTEVKRYGAQLWWQKLIIVFPLTIVFAVLYDIITKQIKNKWRNRINDTAV